MLAAQANFAPGGCLLVLSVAPSASDGSWDCMLTVTKLWANHCSGLLDQQKAPRGVSHLHFTTDITLLDTFLREERIRQSSPHPEDHGSAVPQLVGLDAISTQQRSQNDPNGPYSHHMKPYSHHMKPSIFYMPQSAYTTLRKECIEEFGTADVSGNGLVCALILRSIIRASTSLNAQHAND